MRRLKQNMELTKKIESWAIQRGLDGADPTKQMLKLMEETGELASGMARGNLDLIIDSIGDIYVVLTILSMQLGLSIEECIESSYEEIKNRKGKLINGVFVKENE
jgi:NTP pyrophosphatase (non-canonical NTP hydrolase)